MSPKQQCVSHPRNYARIVMEYYNYLSVAYCFLKIKIHSSCEIEYSVETRLCELCVILRSRSESN